MKPSFQPPHTDVYARKAGEPSTRGRWYPMIFVVGMAIVIAVNGVLITTAISSFSGLQTETAYQDGLTYNATIAAAQRQDQLGWQIRLITTPRSAAGAASHAVDLIVAFTDRDGRPLKHRSVEALFVRPTLAGHDFEVSLADKGYGTYSAPVEAPLSGQWDVTILAHYRASDGGDRTWQTTRRIYLP